MPDDDAAQDFMIRAAVEFGVVKRRLLPKTGIRPSVCNAKRCLEALRFGNIELASKYLTMAESRDPGEWTAFAELVRSAIGELRSRGPSPSGRGTSRAVDARAIVASTRARLKATRR